MAPQLPISRDWGGDNEAIPLPVVISPEQPSSAELEAGTEGFSPDRLLRQAKLPTGALEISPQPPPPPPRGAPWYCCSSDPKEQQRAQHQCTGRVCLALRCCCCLFGVSLALLVAYWSLVPMCTTCRVGVSSTLSSSSSAAGGVEVASMEGGSVGYDVQPFSTLHINQLQVILLWRNISGEKCMVYETIASAHRPVVCIHVITRLYDTLFHARHFVLASLDNQHSGK